MLSPDWFFRLAHMPALCVRPRQAAHAKLPAAGQDCRALPRPPATRPPRLWRRQTFGEYTAGQRTRANGHNPLGRGHGVINFFQRKFHVVRHRADDQQHIGMARRRCDKKSQPVHVVIRIVELLDFVETRAAIARIHDADVNGTFERLAKFVRWPSSEKFPIRRFAANQPDVQCRERNGSNERNGERPAILPSLSLNTCVGQR